MNKEIKLSQEQDKNDLWIQWRNGGIGASEQSILLGALPFGWNDCLRLWKVKTGLAESDFVMNENVLFGKQTEAEARKKYTKATGIKVTPTCYETIQYPFIRASLDGINKKLKHIVEIKVPSLSGLQKAKKGIMPHYYYPQIQAQLYAANAQTAHFWSYRPEFGGILMEVKRNEEYIQELIRRSKIFWECVESKTPCLPHMLNINMTKSEGQDPFEVGDMSVELLGKFKN